MKWASSGSVSDRHLVKFSILIRQPPCDGVDIELLGVFVLSAAKSSKTATTSKLALAKGPMKQDFLDKNKKKTKKGDRTVFRALFI